MKVETLPKVVQEKTQFLNPDYLLFSQEARDPQDPLPLLIYLHGGGGRGNDISVAERKSALAVKTVQASVNEPSFIIAPQCLKGNDASKGIWLPEDLNLLLAHLKATLPIDEDRVYLTGHSMGGYGTWVWTATHPEHFAAVVPSAGGLGRDGPVDITPDFDQWAKSLSTVPLWAFHGAIDKTVPANRSESMVKAIKSNGGKKVKLTIYPEIGHNSANATHSNPELYHWLFKHRRNN